VRLQVDGRDLEPRRMRLGIHCFLDLVADGIVCGSLGRLRLRCGRPSRGSATAATSGLATGQFCERHVDGVIY